MTHPLIALLTDFGLTDTYLGQMKAVIHGRCPTATVIDLTHAVAPQDVRQGAFLLEGAINALPSGTITVAVVDPGVGGDRRGIAIQTATHIFVGPDNGLLSTAVPHDPRAQIDQRTQGQPSPPHGQRIPVPSGLTVVELTNAAFQWTGVAATFHGRDIFAPAAAALACGTAIDELGPRVPDIWCFPPFRARRDEDGTLHATIITVDRFGNLITDCHADDLPGTTVRVHGDGWTAAGLVRTYADAAGSLPVALIGSSGYLEIAVANGDAARVLRVTQGSRVRIMTDHLPHGRPRSLRYRG